MSMVPRRAVLGAVLASGTLGVRGARASVPADVTVATLRVHSYGSPDAKLVVQEWFSLTCTHCAHFSATVFPEVKAKLIDTGKIRYVFKDFPLDQVALAAAMAADALPEGQYLPFVEALLSSQNSWAFDRSADPIERIGQVAALAGLPPDAFKRTMADTSLRQAILEEQDRGQKQYNIGGTPCFVFGSIVDQEVADYATFARQVAAAGG